MLLVWENDYELRLEKDRMKCQYQELIQWNDASISTDRQRWRSFKDKERRNDRRTWKQIVSTFNHSRTNHRPLHLSGTPRLFLPLPLPRVVFNQTQLQRKLQIIHLNPPAQTTPFPRRRHRRRLTLTLDVPDGV